MQKDNEKNRELTAVVMPNGSIHLEWEATLEKVNEMSRALQDEFYKQYKSDSTLWLLFLGFCDKDIPLHPSLDFLRKFTGLFAERLRLTPDLEMLRQRVKVPFQQSDLDLLIESIPLMNGSEYINREFLKNLWSEVNRFFADSIKSYKGTVEAFIRQYRPDAQILGRVYFHLVENKDDEYPFAFMATYSTRLDSQGKSKHLPLKQALEEYKDDNEKLIKLLGTVYSAAKKSRLIDELLETAELFHPLAWKSGEAFSFLKEIPVYEEAGILCRIPNWWKGAAASVRLNISVGGSRPSFVNMDALLSFKAELMLGDIPISEKEAKSLLNESEGLAYIKNKWVAVDPKKLKQTLDAYEGAKKMMKEEGLSFRDALRLQLNPQRLAGIPTEGVGCSVSNGKWLKSVIKKLIDPALIASVKPDRSFKADLRDYQQRGLNWLCFLHSLQFGACLADDMGLGKTVQVLAFLGLLKTGSNQSQNDRLSNLLVIPASLIANWENEIQRFSPSLEYFIAHPGFNSLDAVGDMEKGAFKAYDLVITTYAMCVRYEHLQEQSWGYIILDEAQAIKNPGTKQARAIKKLNSRNRIIMTGTPVENSLTDLWSLFDFLNPGLLGTSQEFKAYSKGLKKDPAGFAGLRKLIRPYILRRLKTDKSVISDLPDKVEMKTYAGLSRKQIVLYQKLVNDIKRTIQETEGIQRKGIILASLVKFKQLCNHPDQYLGTGGYPEKESGKFGRLREICETVLEKREKILVFTQFKEITEPLRDFMESIFNRKGLVLHGSVAVGKRKKIIEQLQGNGYIPFMVLSLKAGGVGLNLTEANHVVHFDRWWNPAVENQATDRAFRIGQKRTVIVHKFLTRGTVEEKIDAMLEEKAALSKDVISSSGESWITEMKDDELIDMFTLKL